MAPGPQGSDPRPRVLVTRLSAVLVAAGASRRLGRPKQLLDWHGEPLVRRAARAALDAGVDELVVVLGAEAEAVQAALEGLDVRIVEHPGWPEGMGSSIAAGVGAATGDAVLVLTCDQPGVDAALLRLLVEAMQAGHTRVACAYSGVVGVPALFSAPADFAALRALSGEQGARGILRSDAHAVCAIAAAQAAHDIDDEAAWERWQAENGEPDQDARATGAKGVTGDGRAD